MSLILDALNRAERERQKSQPLPDIHTRHPLPPIPPEPAAQKSSWFGVAILLVVILLAAAASAFWWMREHPEPTLVQPAASIPPAAAEIGQEPSAHKEPSANKEPSAHKEPSANKEPSADREPSANQEPSANKEPSAIKAPSAHQQFVASSAPPARSISEQKADLAALYAEANQQPEPAGTPDSESQRLPQEPAQQLPPPQPLAEPAAAQTYASLIELPDVGDLPWSLRQEIPSINYSSHNFTDTGAASVVINGQAYRAGQTLADELRLEAIYVDGVIIRFRQTRFKLRALNSWINM